MKHLPSHRIGSCVFFPLFAALLASGCVAPEKEQYAKNGFYLGALGAYRTIGGDFDGDTAFIEPWFGEGTFIPSIGGGFGPGIAAGVRADPFALELGWASTRHDAEVAGVSLGDADLRMLSVRAKWFFNTAGKLQPHILGGLDFPWLRIENVSFTFDPNTGEVTSMSDDTFNGIGLHAGAGVAYYFTPHLSLALTGQYQFLDFDGTDTEFVEHLDGSGLGASVGLFYTF